MTLEDAKKTLPKLLRADYIIFQGRTAKNLTENRSKVSAKNQQEQLQCYFIKSSNRYSSVSNQTLSIGKSLVQYDEREITSNKVSQRVTSMGTGEQLPTNAKQN